MKSILIYTFEVRVRDRYLKKNYFNKRAILASGLRTIYFSENPNELCDKLKLFLQEKRAWK